jgi:hypothetical protein
VRAQGTRFMLNGSPYYANGFNAYWLMTMAADPAQRGKVTFALSQAAGRGLTVARTWAFSDGGSNALQYSPGKYNENTFKVPTFCSISVCKKNWNIPFLGSYHRCCLNDSLFLGALCLSDCFCANCFMVHRAGVGFCAV